MISEIYGEETENRISWSIFVCLALKHTDRKRKEIASFLGRTAKMVCHLERKVDGRI
ncbi:hypothetical protein KAX75_03105 [candidate division WOR-3 bacterium]|nr:hypothetical protein [candidate division WOR-3 bacterium]